MFYCINITVMKKLIGSKSKLLLGIFIFFAIFSISNNCIKPMSDDNLPPQPDPIMNEVSVQRGGFNPMVISVEAGTLITWTSKDDIAESVTSSTGQFDGIISSYGSYSYQFSTPGTYPYYSRMNPNLTGKVIVN